MRNSRLGQIGGERTMRFRDALRGLLACAALTFHCAVAQSQLVPMQARLDPTVIVEDCNNGTDQSTTVQVLGPASLQPGKPARVQVSVRNTSASTLWFGEQTQVPTRLGAWNGNLQGHNNQVRWDGWECGGYRKNGVGDQRSFISDPKSPDNNCHAPGNVGPNGERTFDFNITAPLGATGTTKFSWAMVVEFGTQCNGFFKEAWYVDVPVSGADVKCSIDPGPKANDSQFLLEVWNNETLDAITGTDGSKTEDAFPVERRWVNPDFVTDTNGSVSLPLDAIGGQTRLSQCAGLAHYTARLTGSVPLKAGTYTFKASADDGVRVSINNASLINKWAAPQSIPDNAPEIARATALSAGSYNVVIEYLQADGGAHLNLN